MNATFEIYRDSRGQQWARRRRLTLRDPNWTFWHVTWGWNELRQRYRPRRERHWVPDDIQ